MTITTDDMLRRRTKAPPEFPPADHQDEDHQDDEKEKLIPKVTSPLAIVSHHPPINKLSYRVAKWAILRLLGSVYLIAFLGAYYQNKGLLGKNGLQPAFAFLKRLRTSYDSNWQAFLQHPTLFWWIPVTDANMDAVAVVGIILSAIVVLGVDSWLIMVSLWLLDFSIVTLAEGTSFYSYGWESQLLETGFLAVFLCQLPHISHDSHWRIRALWRDGAATEPSMPVLYLFRWLCFRISLGAGLIKVRGSTCWAAKTCLWYHFETQPIPSPLSFIFHFLPKWVLSRAVDLDLMVQLYTSWFVLVPGGYGTVFRWVLRIGGFAQAGFMVNIILSGNFAFLNHLTIIPALACLDDACWPSFLKKLATKAYHQPTTVPKIIVPPRLLIDGALVLLIGSLSSPVVTNLLQRGGSRQIMNGSFDTFRLVNTYGAFGSVGEARFEPIISVSTNGTDWTEIQFPCKPGKVTRRPCFSAPYHYRLDWNIWFIGFPPHKMYLQRRESWLYTLLEKILRPDETENPWLDLLDGSSASLLRTAYASGKDLYVPRLAKVDMFHYQMTAPLWLLVVDKIQGGEVTWWRRTYKESLIPPVRLDGERNKLTGAIQS
jgi:hypothetical protein